MQDYELDINGEPTSRKSCCFQIYILYNMMTRRSALEKAAALKQALKAAALKKTAALK